MNVKLARIATTCSDPLAQVLVRRSTIKIHQQASALNVCRLAKSAQVTQTVRLAFLDTICRVRVACPATLQTAQTARAIRMCA